MVVQEDYLRLIAVMVQLMGLLAVTEYVSL